MYGIFYKFKLRYLRNCEINLIVRPDASLAKVSNSSPATARGALEIREWKVSQVIVRAINHECKMKLKKLTAELS